MGDLVLFNNITSLETLSLSIDGPGNKATYPEAGKHLATMHPKQGLTKISTLNPEGDPFFVFWVICLFFSKFLYTFDEVNDLDDPR